MLYVWNLNYEKHTKLRLLRIEVLNTHQIFSSSYSQPKRSISLAASPWSWPGSIYSAFLFKHEKIHFFLYHCNFFCLVSNIWNWQPNIRTLGTIIVLKKLSTYMTGVFIQLHSRLIDFSTLSFLFLKWKFTTISQYLLPSYVELQLAKSNSK